MQGEGETWVSLVISPPLGRLLCHPNKSACPLALINCPLQPRPAQPPLEPLLLGPLLKPAKSHLRSIGTPSGIHLGILQTTMRLQLGWVQKYLAKIFGLKLVDKNNTQF